MNLLKTIISFSVTCILLVNCEEIIDKQEIEPEDTLSNPLIGTWTYQSGRTELYLTSGITQSAIDYSQRIQGSVEIDGSEEVTFKHFTNDILFWSGVPNYLLTTDFPWNFPRTELRLFDTSGVKSADLSVSAQHYYSDTIEWEYSNLTGILHIPPTQLYSQNHSDSVTVAGNAIIPMLILEAEIPTLVLYLDTIRIVEPLPEVELLQSDSMLIWDDTPQDHPDVGEWYVLNDTLCFITNGDSSKYSYEIQEDTLSLVSPKMIETSFDLYEVYGDLEPNSIQAGWDLILKKYIRKY